MYLKAFPRYCLRFLPQSFTDLAKFIDSMVFLATVSRRFEPSSRIALIGEQPNPWNLLQLQDAMSRHRGAKPSRRYGLLD